MAKYTKEQIESKLDKVFDSVLPKITEEEFYTI